jgi:hypothetical protein
VEYEEAKFEQYKLAAGEFFMAEIIKIKKSCSANLGGSDVGVMFVSCH